MTKLKNNQTDNIYLLNPYTFVPFQKVPPKPEAWEQKYSSPEDLLTGWLDIELIPKTPIIIPDTAHREEKKVKNKKGADTVHNKYPFLRLPDTDGDVYKRQNDPCGMIISAVNNENEEEKLHCLMVDEHILTGAKLY